MKFKIYTDGGSRGNPGPGAFAFLIFDEAGHLVTCHKECLGVTTNNTAEYRGVLAALEEAKKRGAQDIDLFTDSELVSRQLVGKYKIKQPHLRALATKVREVETFFKEVTYTHLPREHEKIQMADELVNQAIDDAMIKSRKY